MSEINLFVLGNVIGACLGFLCGYQICIKNIEIEKVVRKEIHKQLETLNDWTME